MKVEISVIQQDLKNQTLFNLKEWIQDEKIKGVRISTLNLPTGEGKMGIDPDTVVAVLSSVVAGFELISSIFGWVKSKKNDTKIKITIDGREIELSSSAMSNEKETIKTILHLLESSPKKGKK